MGKMIEKRGYQPKPERKPLSEGYQPQQNPKPVNVIKPPPPPKKMRDK